MYHDVNVNNRGFTLVELVVAIAIMTIMAVIVLGGFARWRTASKIEGDVDAIWSYLQDARLVAFSEKRNLQVRMDSSGKKITITDPNDANFIYPDLELQSPFRITSTGTFDVNMRGYYSPGRSIILNNGMSHTVVPTSQSCVVVSTTRARKARWTGGDNCDVL